MTKRKTFTSTEVKNRYNDKVYTALTVRVPKDLAEAFKEKSKASGTPQRQIFIDAIEKFLRD